MTQPETDIVSQLIDEATKRAGTVVLPEGGEDRIVQAARRIADTKLARPVLLGAPEEIGAAAARAGVSLDGVEMRDPASDARIDDYARACAARRERMTPAMAARLVKKPLYFGGMMVAESDASVMVGGVANPTRRVIEAGMMTVGLAPGIATASSFFLMVVPDFLGGGPKAFIYADCAVNVDPTAEELAGIALASAETASRLLREPARVALLSFSTHGSAAHAHVDKVTRALAIARATAPSLLLDGELQADAAIVPRVGAAKIKHESPVAGRANVLVFPDLDAGNIGYKLTQYMAGAKAIGPVLQGFARPICDLSRGASVDDIVAVAAIGLLQSAS